MHIQDLRHFEDGQTIDAELCIVGSGPAGLTLAGEFIGAGISTLIVESGGMDHDAMYSALNEIESVGEPRVMDHTLVRDRRFGGTSHSWTGRCAPLDEIDFAPRPWVPFSGWPIDRRDLLPFLERANPYIGLNLNCYSEDLWNQAGHAPPTPRLDSHLLRNCFWQFSRDHLGQRDFMRFGRAFLARKSPDIRILLHASVTELQVNESGSQLTGAMVASLNGKQAAIKAKTIVLCAGGIENPRIMLYSNRTLPAGVGNQHNVVGAFLMDHPRCTLAEFDPEAAYAMRQRYGLFRLGEGAQSRFFVQGVTLSPELQAERQLLNCAAWLTEHRAPDDPWEAAKRVASARANGYVRDIWRILSQPRTIARGLNDWLLRGRGVPHKLDRLALDCIVEQRPNPDSRVLLGERKDPLGLPCTRIDWRISAQEKTTVSVFADLIAQEFKRIGLPDPKLAGWTRNAERTIGPFVDASHPIGTTRMGHSPRSSVVDANCQVHGLAGLYVAGSSVFPTAGHANPTLMIVALAIRLADHLKAQVFPRAS